MPFPLWLKNFISWDADLPNGELFFKSHKDYHQNKLFNKMLGLLQDMRPFANKMVLFQLWNQKFCLTAPILLNTVNELLKKF